MNNAWGEMCSQGLAGSACPNPSQEQGAWQAVGAAPTPGMGHLLWDRAGCWPTDGLSSSGSVAMAMSSWRSAAGTGSPWGLKWVMGHGKAKGGPKGLRRAR